MRELAPYLIAILIPIIYRLVLPATILDDAYITMRTARNLSLGNGMVFNLGERVFTVTTVLWTMLNALPRVFGLDSIASIWILGLLSEMALAAVLVRIGKSIFDSRWIGTLSAAFLMTNPVFLISSLGGMELPLSLCAIASAFLLLHEKRTTGALLISAIAVWIRVDNLLLLSIIGLWCILDKDRRGRLRDYIPAAVVVAVYLIATWIYYGIPLPVSVLRKAAFPETTLWRVGALRNLTEFAWSIAGKFGTYSLGKLPYLIVPLLVIVGIYSAIKSEKRQLLPLATFTIAYILAFVISGKTYATLFPWYFAPPLLLAALIAASGLDRLFAETMRSKTVRIAAIAVAAVLWAAIMFPFDKSDATEYRDEIMAGREKVYASTTLWLESNFPGRLRICTGEIGAIGFFADDETKVVDMVGLTRPPGDNRLPVQLVIEERVEAIIYWLFRGQEYNDIAPHYPNYEWGQVGDVLIGFRADLAGELLPKSPQLMEIYEEIDMNAEYRPGSE